MNTGASFFGPVSGTTVTFVAVSQQSSDRSFAFLVGVVGALPFAGVIVLVMQVIHAVAS